MANLKYLFECHLKDGTILTQTQDDVSAVEPTKSAFYDVHQRLEEVEIFGIFNDDVTYVVDLRDGHFEIDGLPFDVHSGEELPTTDCKFRLVYFRRVKQTVVLGQIDTQESTTAYHLGWQTTIDGKNYQQTISIS